jgi:hypothetical protein
MITFDLYTKQNNFFQGREFISYKDYFNKVRSEIDYLKRQGCKNKNYYVNYIKENHKNINENDIDKLI